MVAKLFMMFFICVAFNAVPIITALRQAREANIAISFGDFTRLWLVFSLFFKSSVDAKPVSSASLRSEASSSTSL